MDLERIAEIGQASGVERKDVLRLGVSILFLAGIIVYVGSQGEVSPMLIIAGMIGGYMALNIGANDVGPAVGSRALTMVGTVGGVGFLREYLKRNYSRMMEQIQLHHMGRDQTDVE